MTPSIDETVCSDCDGRGGSKTYANQVCMPLNGRVQCIDKCIHHIVAALNAAGVETVASCCGHQKDFGRIDLADGRILHIEAPNPANCNKGRVPKEGKRDDRSK